ncbi:MAG: hypothetical protein IT445_00080 [Phycisphaeraceae bacterium]|nr:hypothetical protein [Phycisphaeraceae bacterium]
MISEVLQRLSDQGRLDVPRLAESACISTSSIYRWITGEREPGFTNICRLFREAAPEVQAEILSLLTAGTNWQAVPVDQDLDVNGDGRVDLIDALKANADAAADSAMFLRRMSGEMTADMYHLDALHEMSHRAADAAGQLMVAAHIIDQVIEHRFRGRGQRRKCRPLPTSGGQPSAIRHQPLATGGV